MGDYPTITEIPTDGDLVFYLDDECADASDCLHDLIDWHDGRDVEIDAGTVIYVAEKAHASTSSFLPDFDDIVDQMANAAWDSGSEHAEDFPDIADPAAAKRELEDLLEAWADKHVNTPRWYICENIRRYVVTQADMDAWAAPKGKPNA